MQPESIETNWSQQQAQLEANHALPDVLSHLRQKSLREWLIKGWPTRQDEEWHYTSARPFKQTPFSYINDSEYKSSAEEKAENHSYFDIGMEAYDYVWFQQSWHPKSSEVPALQALGLEVSSWGEVGDRSILPAIDALIHSPFQLEDSPLSHLGRSFLQNGHFIRVKKGAKISKPLRFFFPSLPSNEGGVKGEGWGSWRQVYFLEADTHVMVHEIWAGDERDKASSAIKGCQQTISDFYLGPRAKLNYSHFVAPNVGERLLGQMRFALQDEAWVKAGSFAMAASWQRYDWEGVLNGEGAQLLWNALTAGREGAHIDHTFHMQHQGKSTRSTQQLRQVLGKDATGVFQSHIKIGPSAANTDALQNCKNLLLSPTAKANVKPHLSIATDEVKCKHGVTSGQLRSEEIFYLQSRGIPREVAQRLLWQAFAKEIVEEFDENVTRTVASRMIGQLPL